jgi:hypothetical protein
MTVVIIFYFSRFKVARVIEILIEIEIDFDFNSSFNAETRTTLTTDGRTDDSLF